MSAEETLYTTLAGAAGVSALVSTRIYPDEIPLAEGVPAIAYRRLSTEPVITISSGRAMAETATLEIACLASTRAGADDVADAAHAAAGPAGFALVDRVWEHDPENGFFATVLTVEKFSNL